MVKWENNPIRTFEDLVAWQLARRLRIRVYESSKSFPPAETYALTSQIRRAAVSATANIAEGYGRFHYRENVQFCRQARGSLYEVIDHLITANDLGFLSDEDLTELKSSVYHCIKVLNGLIASLIQRSQKNITPH